MAPYSIYTAKEREIVAKIHSLESQMLGARKRYLNLDVKRIALIHELKGKYISKARY